MAECNALHEVYSKQISYTSRSPDFEPNNALNLNTQPLYQELINIVDANPGLNKEFGLPFTEFDSTLQINLDFKNLSCIQSLMTDLGVEELRSILKYQVMHQQLLTVAVMTNQFILDAPSQGLKEVELLEKNIVVPNSVLMESVAVGRNVDRKKEAAANMQSFISSNTNLMYFIKIRKDRDRETVVKKFQKMLTRVTQ